MSRFIFLSDAAWSLWGCKSPPTRCAGPYLSQNRPRERLWRGSLERQRPLSTRAHYRYIYKGRGYYLLLYSVCL